MSSKASSTTSRQSVSSRVRSLILCLPLPRRDPLICVSRRHSPPESLLLGPTAEYRLRSAAICATCIRHCGPHVVLPARTDANGFPRTEPSMECERQTYLQTSRPHWLTIRAPASRRNCLPSQATLTTTSSQSSSIRSPKLNRPRSSRNSCRRTTTFTGRETTRARRARSR